MDWVIGIVLLLLGLAVGGFVGYRMRQANYQKEMGNLEAMRARLLEEAEKQARDTVLNAKDETLKLRVDLEAEMDRRGEKLRREEERLQSRRDQLDARQDRIDKREQLLNKRQSALDKRWNDMEKLEEEQRQVLERVANLSAEEAREVLLERVAGETRQDMARVIREEELRAHEEAERRAREIVTVVVQRIATEQVAELTTKTLEIPSDELKGRIIGRGGRNIRVFEQKAGVDIIVDDSPEMITISSFNPIMREVAARAMHRLVADGRIHPARIEEVVEKVKKELEEEIIHLGENTLLEIGLHGAHPEIVKHIGRMKYRSSYGQNLLEHSIEVAYLTGIMASELRLDPVLAKRAGLLHDIGKTIDKSVEGPHALLGYELCKKFNEHAVVCNAVGSHHEDIPMEHPIAALVQAADAISGARPGARRESVEEYIKRLERLEGIAKSFAGVLNTYAIQAGREVRVIVSHEKLDDAAADQLAHDIANKIEQEMEYPGQIKVVVVREFRSIAVAK
jgi:ribonuclease Y